jgi:hypothetical protein
VLIAEREVRVVEDQGELIGRFSARRRYKVAPHEIDLRSDPVTAATVAPTTHRPLALLSRVRFGL